MRRLLADMLEDLRHLEERFTAVTREIEAHAAQDERSRRLLTVPGIGPLVATAILASAGDGRQFRSAGDMGACLGLVPRQHSTGSDFFFQLKYVRWLMPARRQISATGIPSAPRFKMNAFWASEKFDAFIVFRSSQPGDVTAENPIPNDPVFRDQSINYSDEGMAVDTIPSTRATVARTVS